MQIRKGMKVTYLTHGLWGTVVGLDPSSGLIDVYFGNSARGSNATVSCKIHELKACHGFGELTWGPGKVPWCLPDIIAVTIMVFFLLKVVVPYLLEHPADRLRPFLILWLKTKLALLEMPIIGLFSLDTWILLVLCSIAAVICIRHKKLRQEWVKNQGSTPEKKENTEGSSNTIERCDETIADNMKGMPAGSIWEAVTGIIKKIRNRIAVMAPPSEVIISLEELSQIWLPRGRQSMENKAPVTLPAGQIVKSSAESSVPGVQPEAKTAESKAADAYSAERDIVQYQPFEKFWNEYIEPNIVSFRKDGSLPVISELIEILTNEGNCPSVVVSEKIFNKKSALDLCKITLQQHSLRVAVNMLEAIRVALYENEYRLAIPPAITAALGHDIGKLPKYSSDPNYSKHDHPVTSANLIKELFQKYNAHPPWLDNVRGAILTQNTGITSDDNDIAAHLLHADFKAREQELAKVRKMPVKDCAEWLNVDELLKRIEQKINVLESTGKHTEFHSFTHKGTVYVRSESLYDTARSMYPGANAVDFTFEYLTDAVITIAKKNIIKKLGDSKKLQRGYDANLSPTGKLYVVTIVEKETKQPRYYLVPLPVEQFAITSGELEKRKSTDGGWLFNIKDVSEHKMQKKNK